jgi:hypothetical protein
MTYGRMGERVELSSTPDECVSERRSWPDENTIDCAVFQVEKRGVESERGEGSLVYIDVDARRH